MGFKHARKSWRKATQIRQHLTGIHMSTCFILGKYLETKKLSGHHTLHL
jgi:hypothetical protein